ncbi:MAG TPA: hypothetical protein VN797_05075 [Gemmatimonadaceae bacterium]|nr:hypothetical protein [Gemmatimonadaceae bacterium]
MAKEPEEEGGEFADFLADVSKEIAERVESLAPAPKPPKEEKKKTPVVAASERRKTPVAEAGLIVEWPNIADRVIEEIR